MNGCWVKDRIFRWTHVLFDKSSHCDVFFSQWNGGQGIAARNSCGIPGRSTNSLTKY